MKVAIIGSRKFSDYELLKRHLSKFDGLVKEIFSGGAAGVDTLAERFAKEKGIKMTVVKPDWSKFGKSAGVIRNKEIVEKADYCVAFWDGLSKGTSYGIKHCELLGKPVEVIKIKVA